MRGIAVRMVSTLWILLQVLGLLASGRGEASPAATADQIRLWVDLRSVCQKLGDPNVDLTTAESSVAVRVCSLTPAELTTRDADEAYTMASARSLVPSGAKAAPAPGSAATAGGVNWESQLLNGLTAFLLDRARAEAVEGFLVTVKEDFCGSSGTAKGKQIETAWGELAAIEASVAGGTASEKDRTRRRELLGEAAIAARRLFPQTCAFVSTFTFGSTTGPFGGAWQSALVDDTDSLLEHYFEYRDWPRDDGAALGYLARTLQKKLRAIQQGQHPLEALRQLATDESVYAGAHPNCESAIDRAHAMLYDLGLLAAAGLRESGGKYVWKEGGLTAEELGELVKHAACVPSSDVPRLLRINDLGKEIVRQVQEARDLKAKGQRTDAQVAAALLHSAQAFLQIVEELKIPGAKPEEAARFVRLAALAADARIAAADGNYGLLTVKVASFVIEVDQALGTGGVKLPESVIRLTRFAADLGAAKSEADVKAALEAHAAPLGSFRAKRGGGNRTTTLTGFVGLSGGYEWLTAGGTSDADRRGSSRMGLWVPVGLDMSWGGGEGHSFSVYVPLIDLGALADFRLTHDGVDQAPNVGFKQVLSPGLFLTYGFSRKLPITAGLGAQVSPELRRVSADGTLEKSDRTAIRAGVFVAIDVTLFRF